MTQVLPNSYCTPRVEHDTVIHSINTQLGALQMTCVWSFVDEPVQFTDLADETVIPEYMV